MFFFHPCANLVGVLWEELAGVLCELLVALLCDHVAGLLCGHWDPLGLFVLRQF